MKNLYLCFSICIMIFSCDSENVISPDLNGKTAIRIQNVSPFKFENIVVNTQGGENMYGALTSIQTSEYKLFDFAYRYAFVELYIDGKVATIQPIDFFGETKLDTGYYTYQIGTTNSTNQHGRLSLTLVED
ncbi:MAG: hypothetical protein ABJG78_05690 [Cyclobacteriaceae bacterium]